MATKKKGSRTAKPRKFTEKKSQEKSQGFFDYFRFGESYTSLILGIVVVIITAILLVTFVRNRNIGQISESNKQISTISTVASTPTPEVSSVPSVTKAPTLTASPTSKPTLSPTRVVTPTTKPTVIPTKVIAKAPTATVTLRPTSKPKATNTPWPTSTPRPTSTVAPTKKLVTTTTLVPTKVVAKATPTPIQTMKRGSTYIVQRGDSLWVIAEKVYQSGYNYIDIAKANKLIKPGSLEIGQRLLLPNVASKTVTVAKTELKPQKSVTGPAITGTTYTVVKGDYLWDISIRAYGTGFKYAEIAKTNKITNPSLIFAGTKLNIPR